MTKEIKSTDTGFVIVDGDNNIIEEFNENEAIEKLLNETREIKSLMDEWVEHSHKLNELTEQILNRETDEYVQYGWQRELLDDYFNHFVDRDFGFIWDR